MSKEIWQQTEEEVLSGLGSFPEGLTGQEAARRLNQYGPNELREGEKKSTFRIFLEQFLDFLVIILIIAAAVSAVLGDVESMVVILAVITMNAILGTVQTVKAEASLDSLKQMAAPTAKVLRDGQLLQIPGREVVPGDVVLLEAGDAVCADGRLLECASLKTAEAALTGESLPVEKTTEVIPGDAPLGDRRNLVFSGSFVTYGRGRFLVTGTGMETEMGKIAALLKSTSEKKTPLQASLDQFGRKLSIGILILCALIFAVSVLVQGESVVNAFLFAVALAVAAIPEALSSIVTIVLSFGTRKMAQENAIIRKIQSVEGLGSVSVICSDKTGTLTQNRMTVRQLFVNGSAIPVAEADFQNPAQEALLRAALLCSDATVTEQGEIGDPTETALVRLGQEFGFKEDEVRTNWSRLGELPFDSDRKLMSTVHRFSGGLMLMTKGAVDVLLDRTVLGPGEKEEIEAANRAFSDQGLRVLAFACRSLASEEVTLADEDELFFLGLIAMMDPPREESKAAVASCISAGIRPIMITGDHVITASAIAREIGILRPGEKAVEGAVIETMSDGELRDFVPEVSVYARVSPEHKIRIVRAWQDRGALVAMTGDGVNDAPALKQADIGVAMGITGTEVAKDAAGMVLADDNFATIVQAVKNGRNLYANICRAIQFLLSGNMAGILTVLYASLMSLPVPFAAVHLLFINLLTDSLPAIALGLEPHSDSVMHDKPRPRSEGILTKPFLINVGIEGLVIALATVAACVA
ncbi:MAG: HAD-IC family P-type ATPase, partial [Ruminiclostridium sp.]|nr:HAD-IC family P-type ATPase [Ruminiclostridium sp.]